VTAANIQKIKGVVIYFLPIAIGTNLCHREYNSYSAIEISSLKIYEIVEKMKSEQPNDHPPFVGPSVDGHCKYSILKLICKIRIYLIA